MARSFEELEEGKDTGLCPRCQENPRKGAVLVRLMKFRNGESSRLSQVTSRQVSVCENCGVEVYEELMRNLNEETGGGTRKPRSTYESKQTPVSSRRRSRRRAA